MKFRDYIEAIVEVYEENIDKADWEVIDSNANSISKEELVNEFSFNPGMNGYHFVAPFVVVPNNSNE